MPPSTSSTSRVELLDLLRPAQRWVRDFLSGRAVSFGWPLKLPAAASSGRGA
ncbi:MULTISPECIES: hypothetical protein [unclassified Bradyrhizobium]|uniref:hypothetical protein n=1 Tax=unclassified Bradyrhizobium TaxID=2631580 RepID=UPI002FF0C27F